MARLTPEEIENLQNQLKEKTEEIKTIYNKLVEGGAVPLPDEFLDNIGGGAFPSLPPLFSNSGVDPWR